MFSIFKRKRKDIPGSREDGIFDRYPGGVIEFFRLEEDVHRFMISRPEWEKNRTGNELPFEEVQGERTTVIYQVPIPKNPDEIFDFYAEQFRNKGLKIFYAENNEALLGKPEDWFTSLYLTGKNISAWFDLSIIMRGKIYGYLSGGLRTGNHSVYASVFAVNHFRNNRYTGIIITLSRSKTHISIGNPQPGSSS